MTTQVTQEAATIAAIASATPPRRSTAATIREAFSAESLLRAVGEIIIVTIGILIAFVLNAWWENHKEQRQEQAHLRALASDFEQNVEQLQLLVAKEELIQQSSLQLLRIARTRQEASAKTVSDLARGVFTSRRFQPVMGAYEALVNSAGLTLVHDDALRASLASFAAQVGGNSGESMSNDLYLSFIRSFVGRLPVIEEILQAPPDGPTLVALLADPEFQGYLAFRYAAEGDVENRYRTLLNQARDVQKLLHEQIR
jgi:Family of unknown function (DUF6090)